MKNWKMYPVGAVLISGRAPGGLPTIYPHILGCLSPRSPPGAVEKQLALIAAKRIY